MNKFNSAYLDFVRLFAALIVFVGHLNYEYLVGSIFGATHLPGLGPDAVMVFFVLSGFIISDVVKRRESVLTEYVSARISRLLSIAWPALLITLMCDQIGQAINPDYYQGAWWFNDSHFIPRLGVNLLLLNQLWFFDVGAFSNGPFWSLGYEAFFYAIFVAIGFNVKHRKLLLMLLCLIAGPKILILFPIWLSGYYLYNYVTKTHLSLVTSIILFVLSVLLYITYKTYCGEGLMSSYFTDLVFKKQNTFISSLGHSGFFLDYYFLSLLIILNFLATYNIFKRISDDRMPNMLYRLNRVLALGTFAIYAVHYPIIHCIAALSDYYKISHTFQSNMMMFLIPLMVSALVTYYGNQLRKPMVRIIKCIISRD